MSGRGGRKSSRLPSRTRTVLEYDPLQDPNLQTHFSNPIVRRQLQTVGLIDAKDRILNPSSSGARTRIAGALAAAKRQEVEESLLKREEADIRRRVQHMRLQQIELERKTTLVALMKEQSRIREEIVRLGKNLDGASLAPRSPITLTADSLSMRPHPSYATTSYEMEAEREEEHYGDESSMFRDTADGSGKGLWPPWGADMRRYEGGGSSSGAGGAGVGGTSPSGRPLSGGYVPRPLATGHPSPFSMIYGMPVFEAPAGFAAPSAPAYPPLGTYTVAHDSPQDAADRARAVVSSIFDRALSNALASGSQLPPFQAPYSLPSGAFATAGTGFAQALPPHTASGMVSSVGGSSVGRGQVGPQLAGTSSGLRPRLEHESYPGVMDSLRSPMVARGAPTGAPSSPLPSLHAPALPLTSPARLDRVSVGAANNGRVTATGAVLGEDYGGLPRSKGPPAEPHLPEIRPTHGSQSEVVTGSGPASAPPLHEGGESSGSRHASPARVVSSSDAEAMAAFSHNAHLTRGGDAQVSPKLNAMHSGAQASAPAMPGTAECESTASVGDT